MYFYRKKSAKSSKDDKHATTASPEPGTLIAADGTDAGISGLLAETPDSAGGKKKKKGKGKKKKMTKSEKDLVGYFYLVNLYIIKPVNILNY